MTTRLTTTTAFNPRSIANCALWLDAADTTSIVLSGSNVSQWRDKSGNNNHMNQYSAVTAPSTSNLNGRNTVYFYTSDPTSVQGTPPFTNVQVLQGTNFQTTVNSTLFIVVHPLYVANSTKFIVNLKSRAANQWSNLYDINMGTGDGTNAGGFGTFIRTDTSFLGVDSSYYTINTTNLTSSEIVGTSIAFYKNASLYRSGTVSLSMPASDNHQVFTLGAYLNTDVYDTLSKMGCRAHFCEVIVYNGSLTTSQRQQIEGYLAWKWGLTASLPQTHPFRNGLVPFSFTLERNRKRLTQVFDPRSISGCQLWLDAADRSVFTLTGSNVTQWNDKSGNGYNAIPRSLERTPVRYNGFNGLPTVESSVVSALGNVLLSTIPSSNIQGSSGFSFFMISRFFSGDVFLQYEIPRILSLEGTARFDYGQNNVVYSYPAGFTNTSNHMLNLNLTTASSTIAFTYNGSFLSNYAVNNVTTQFTTSLGIFGRGGVADNVPAFGQISELLIFNRSLLLSQRQQIEGYLSRKWNISLSSSHPNANPLTIAPFPYQNTTRSFKPSRFSPRQIPGCQLWLDAADTNTLFADTAASVVARTGDAVGRWNDKSGNGNYLFQNTTGNRPVLSSFSNKQALYFSTNGLSLNSINNNSSTGNSSRTIFLLQVAPTGTSITRVGTGGHAGNTPPTAFGFDNNATATAILWTPYVYDAPDVTRTIQLRTFSLLYAFYNASLSQVGGGYDFGNIITKSTTLNTTANSWFFGLRPDGGGSTDSYIYEFLHYNRALTQAEINNVEGYIAWKWGLQTTLPSTHPYAKFPPPS
jgi:hypothetical protein